MQPRLKHTLKSMEPTCSNRKTGVFICSYDFANRHVNLLSGGWDLVVADESSQNCVIIGQAKLRFADSVAEIMKWSQKALLLTRDSATKQLEELYGLVSVFDPKYFYSLVCVQGALHQES